MSLSMNNKVALITGGTSGIGRETAIQFAKRGAKVVVTGRREEDGLKTIQLVNEAGGEGLFIKADVAVEANCKKMVDETIAKFGRLDFAFNNAGVEGEMSPVIEETEENFHKVININVLGVLMSMKYEVAAMLKTGGGAIVNTASVASLVGMPGLAVYGASKHAVVGMTKAAAMETAKQGIRINAVSPGGVKTEMYDRFTARGGAEAQEMFNKMHPIGRAGNSDEIALAVLFLCSKDASFITGTNLVVDGGFTVP